RSYPGARAYRLCPLGFAPKFLRMALTRSFLMAVSCAIALLLSSFTGCSHSTFLPPEREGPPALVEQENTPRLWLVLKQEEQRSRHIGGSRRIGKWITEIFYHFDLQAHDPANASRLWKKHLLTVKDDAGGRVAQGRVL